MAQSGALAAESKEQAQGIQLWAEVANASGGINLGPRRIPVELKSYDDQSQPTVAAQAHERLIAEDKVDYLLGAYGSSLGAALAPVAEQHGTTLVLAGSGDEAIFGHGYKHTFQLYTPSFKYFAGALDLLRDTDDSTKKLAFLYENDPNPVGAIRGADTYARETGFQVVASEMYDAHATDFSSYLPKLAASQPQALLGGGHYADGAALVQQLDANKIDLKLVSVLVAPSVQDFGQLGDVALGVLGPSQWEPQVGYSPEAAAKAKLDYFGPAVRDFLVRYREKYGYGPGYHAAASYAAGLILERAVGEAGTIDREPVEAALAATDLMTFFGRIKFDREQHFGLQIGHEMVYVQWQKKGYRSEREIVWPEAAASAKMLYPRNA
jgi:branched-chain amino acid transport system substrate-binding protein